MSSEGTSETASELMTETELAKSGFAPIRNLADRLGICLSALCVIHCLLTPFVLLSLPALEVSVYHEYMHESLLFILPLLAVLAFVPGFIRHRNVSVFAWALPGLVLFSVGATVFHEQIAAQACLSVVGGLLLIRAHWLNRRLCACCETGHSHA